MMTHEIETHQRDVTHKDHRRCINMVLYLTVVNTYGYVVEEFRNLCAVIDSHRGHEVEVS